MQFWKQFFEASANVSLSGYEEPNEEEVTNNEATESFQTPSDRDESTLTGAEPQEDDEEFSVESPTQVTGVQTTPKLTPSSARKSAAGTGQRRNNRSAASSYRSPSPRKYTGRNPKATEPSSEQPSTPRMPSALNFQSSPFQPESAFQPSAFQEKQQNNDPVMHRVLDKNFRVQATPLTQRKQYKPTAAKATPAAESQKAPWDDSPQSSPEVAAPQLRSDLFSPAKGAPRTPGLSILASTKKPGASAPMTSTGRQLFSPEDKSYIKEKNYFDDSDEDDDLAEMSPPKTMQFHVPQSRLMQTPAREASRKIVDDLLLTAGADATDDIEDDFEFDLNPSPSLVQRADDMDEDTF